MLCPVSIVMRRSTRNGPVNHSIVVRVVGGGLVLCVLLNWVM